MQKTPVHIRAAILRCLVEGNSVNSTVRITGAAKNTILSFLVKAGEACAAYQAKHLRNLPCKIIQLDEAWSFVGCREKNKATAVNKHPGDVWTWTSICSETKLMPAFRVGDRSSRTAMDFCADLSTRFTGELQITSDGHPAYKMAVASNFDMNRTHFAQLVKIYGQDEKGNDVVVGSRKQPVFGQPDISLVSTSYVERSNLTIRMGNRRYTRLTNAFSKKIENHCHSLAIQFMYYNFCRKHATIKTAPAVAAGVANHVWTLEEVVLMIDLYFADKVNEQFERAFANLTPERTKPKTYTPTPKDQLPVPWYLAPFQKGTKDDSEKP